MKTKTFLAIMLLLVAGLQTTWGQGFRVYQSDGTELLFSLKTDSIVFDNGLSGDEVFGPFTPVNLCIAKTWYKSKSETVTFNANGTTDYMQGATYEFMPYQGTIIINNASGMPMSILKVHKVTKDMMVLSILGQDDFSVWTATKPVQLVTGITLSETSITLHPDETKRLTATVEPSDADNPAVTWASSNDGVAEVSQSGRVTANANGTCVITCSATDGSGMKAECQVKVKKQDTMEYVDLGLPSHTLWATCNVGANSPEGYGDYFAWGETEPKETYSWSTYQYCNGSYNTLTKYCYQSNYGYNGFTDTLNELLLEDDAATANWGSPWHMPTLEQMQELIDNCTREWTTQGGVNGTLMTGPNGNTIFLPAAGIRWDESLNYAGGKGLYLSSSLHTSYSYNVYYLFFDSDGWHLHGSDRYNGFTVRPVRKQ